MTDTERELRASLEVLIPLIRLKYRGLDDDRLREIFKDVIAAAFLDDAATPESMMAELDRRVNAELRS